MGVCCSKEQGPLGEGGQASPADVQIEAKTPLTTPKRDKSSGNLESLRRAASQGSLRAQAELAKLGVEVEVGRPRAISRRVLWLREWLESHCSISQAESTEYAAALKEDGIDAPEDLHDLTDDDWVTTMKVTMKVIKPRHQHKIKKGIAVAKNEAAAPSETEEPKPFSAQQRVEALQQLGSGDLTLQAAAEAAEGLLPKEWAGSQFADVMEHTHEQVLECVALALQHVGALAPPPISAALQLLGGPLRAVVSAVKTVRGNMKLADKLGKRVIEAARTIQSLLKTMNPNIDADARQQMANAIEGLAATLEEAAGLLGLFGQKGFFKKVLSGNLDARRFAELDGRITRSLELMGQAVGRMTLDLANLAYEAIVAVDAKLGRVEDLMKLQQQLGVSAAAFQEEMGASLEEMKGRQSETLAEVLKGNRMLQEVHSALTVRLSPPMNSCPRRGTATACLSLLQPASACLPRLSPQNAAVT